MKDKSFPHSHRLLSHYIIKGTQDTHLSHEGKKGRNIFAQDQYLVIARYQYLVNVLCSQILKTLTSQFLCNGFEFLRTDVQIIVSIQGRKEKKTLISQRFQGCFLSGRKGIL